MFTASVAVGQNLTGVRISNASGQLVSSGASLTLAGVSQAFAAQGVDQFGNVLGTPVSLVWSATALPAGASAPVFTTNGNVTTVTYAKAGSYKLAVRLANATNNVFTASVVVSQVLAALCVGTGGQTVNSGASLTVAGTTQAFTVQESDQFGNAMSGASLVWSASALPPAPRRLPSQPAATSRRSPTRPAAATRCGLARPTRRPACSPPRCRSARPQPAFALPPAASR